VSAVWVAAVIVCGLLSRSSLLDLPPFFAKYAGDALWALMVFAGIGWLVPSRSTTAVAAWTAAVCGLVEASQLYHAPWIDAVRRTWIGRMALGTTFGWGDLAAYGLGLATGVLTEWAVCRSRTLRSGSSGTPGRESGG
jgi:hypothetical protein